MRSIIFIMAAIFLFSCGEVSAQSKKELKAAAKIQEEINATTSKDGLRFFRTKSTHISFYVTKCYFTKESIMVDMLVKNRNWNDDYITFYGKNSESSYYTCATDNLDRYYASSRFQFATGGLDRFEGLCKDVLVPSGGVLKITMKIDRRAETSKFKVISFGYISALEVSSFTRKAMLKELIIEE